MTRGCAADTDAVRCMPCPECACNSCTGGSCTVAAGKAAPVMGAVNMDP